MAVTRREMVRGVRLIAVTGLLTTVLSCANTDPAGHPRHVPVAATPATLAPWRVVPGARGDCRTRRAHEPSETTVNAVAASGPDDAWAVGECASGGSDVHTLGVVEHWDGTRWRRVPTPPGSSYKSVVALSKKDVWVGGDPLIHWDGRRWRAVSRGLPAGSNVVRMSATGPVSIWTMFAIGDDSHVALARWDTDRWQVVRLPHGCFPPGDGDYPGWAAGAAGDVWVDDLSCSKVPDEAIWHYDGRRWKDVFPAGPGWSADCLRDVDGEPVATLTDRGHPFAADRDRTMTYRWTGGIWRTLPDSHSYTCDPMAGDGHGGMWLFDANPPRNQAQHWDGHRWSGQALAPLSGGDHAILEHVARVPGTATVWGVGYDSEHCCEALIETNGPR